MGTTTITLLINPLTALGTLLLAWFIGNRLTLKWNLVQKWREIDIASVHQFYSLYGEFKEVTKIWRVIKKNKDSGLVVPSDSRWSLLTRACAIEGKNEAILVKVATERDLEMKDLRALGLFRQAVQKLRESIRDDKEIPFASRGPEYLFFNDLVAKVGSIMTSSSHVDATPDPAKASKRLEDVANVRLPCFDAALKSFVEKHRDKETHPE